MKGHIHAGSRILALSDAWWLLLYINHAVLQTVLGWDNIPLNDFVRKQTFSSQFVDLHLHYQFVSNANAENLSVS